MISNSAEKAEPILISVIVPAFNYGHLISETLNSLLQQTWQHWECIIVDDGSKDNTEAVVKSFCEKDPRFIYHYQQNAGLSAARNTGISIAKGQFIQLLDADDLLEQGKFEIQINIFNAHPKADLVYSEVRYFRTSNPNERRFTMDDSNIPWMPKLSSDQHEELSCKLMEMNLMAVNCPLIRTSVFEEIGPFDTNLKSVEDWEYWCRCAISGKYFHFDPSPESYALVRLHDGSMSTNLIKMTQASLLARANVRKLIDRLPESGFKKEISDSERKVTNYLKKLLFQRYKDAGMHNFALKQLWKAYPISKEYRFLLKETIELIRKK